jgi:hypothetical protein
MRNKMLVLIINKGNVSFEVFTVMTSQNSVFSSVTQYSLVV